MKWDTSPAVVAERGAQNYQVFEYPEGQPSAGRKPSPGEPWLEGLRDVFPSIMASDRWTGPASQGAAGTFDAEGSRRSPVEEVTARPTVDREPQTVVERIHNLHLDPEAEETIWRLLKEECDKSEQRGRVEGHRSGEATARELACQRLESERQKLYAQTKALMDTFAGAREVYLEQLEQEVVKLALAISERILRREAQVDPLLLTGAVRVALAQLADSTAVRLYVPLTDVSLWVEGLALIPGMAQQPQVVGDPEMTSGECRVESELGSAALGLRNQLEEIERGFFDRSDDRRSPSRSVAGNGRRSNQEGRARPAEPQDDKAAGDVVPNLCAETECESSKGDPQRERIDPPLAGAT